MTDWKIVYAELKALDARREVVKALRKSIREPLPDIRKSIKRRALAILPHSGGLAKWVAASRINGSVKVKAKTVGLTVKGGRNSAGGRSDVNAIDRGRVRAPSWGRRGPGAWHTQTVDSGFFTDPAKRGSDDVELATDRAVDRALDLIRRG